MESGKSCGGVERPRGLVFGAGAATLYRPLSSTHILITNIY
jgi:hypothetical protein